MASTHFGVSDDGVVEFTAKYHGETIATIQVKALEALQLYAKHSPNKVDDTIVSLIHASLPLLAKNLPDSVQVDSTPQSED